MAVLIRREALVAGTVALCFALVAYFFFTGIYCSDDTRYLFGAMKLAVGEHLAVTSLAERRILFILPAAWAYAAGGAQDLLAIPYVSFFVALGAAGYLLARELLSRRLACLALLLALMQPAFFFYGGAVLPDLPAALFSTLGLLLLLKWARMTGPGPAPSKAAAGSLHSTSCMVGIGASIGLAFTMKESGLLLLPFPLAFIAWRSRTRAWRRTVADLVGLGCGLLLVISIEAVAFRTLAGEWYSSVLALMAPHDMTGFLGIQGRAPWSRLYTLGGALGLHTSFLFALAAVAAMDLAREWQAGKLTQEKAAVWLGLGGYWAWVTFYLTFGTTSVSEYVPPVIQQRYFAPCMIPASILVANWMSRVWRFRSSGPRRRILQVAIALGLVALLTAPAVHFEQRGLIYAAEAKEAHRLARADVARRFPAYPVLGLGDRWAADLDHCRMLINPEDPLHTAAALEWQPTGAVGRIEGLMRPPFLLLTFGEARPPELEAAIAQVAASVGAGDSLDVRRVGHYHPASADWLGSAGWLPRTFAVDRVLAWGRAVEHSRPGDAAGVESASHTSAYLVRFAPPSDAGADPAFRSHTHLPQAEPSARLEFSSP